MGFIAQGETVNVLNTAGFLLLNSELQQCY